MKTSTLLVPFDFTAVTESATKDAITIAKQTKAEVHLLHVVKNTKAMQAANTKLEAFINSINTEGIKVIGRIEAGSIYEDIGRVAEEIKASVIVMGTHGAKGMQKVFGSFAIKVITSTSVPFMVVQEKLINDSIKKIVLPITASKESLQILTSTANLAKALNASVEVVYETKAEVATQRKIKNYAQIALTQLAERGLKDSKAYKLNGKGTYQEQILDFSLRHDADLISVAYYTEKVFAQFDTFAQELITNKHQIPTLIVKTVDSTVGYF